MLSKKKNNTTLYKKLAISARHFCRVGSRCFGNILNYEQTCPIRIRRKPENCPIKHATQIRTKLYNFSSLRWTGWGTSNNNYISPKVHVRRQVLKNCLFLKDTRAKNFFRPLCANHKGSTAVTPYLTLISVISNVMFPSLYVSACGISVSPSASAGAYSL